MQGRRILTGLGGIASAGLVAAVLAAPAIAGGWATVLIDHDTSATAGRAGEPIDVTFTVLQHGVTPVDGDEATVVAVDAASGDAVRVVATAAGSGGVYRAALVLPHEGLWRWKVELGGLIAHSQFQDVAVSPSAAAAATPRVDLLPALVIGIVGASLAASVLALFARRGRRRDPTGVVAAR